MGGCGGASLRARVAGGPDARAVPGAGRKDCAELADGRYFTAAPVLNDEATQVGHVFLYDGNPSWAFAALGEGMDAGAYEVVVVTDSGTYPIATCTVEESSCGAGGAVNVSIYRIDQVRLTPTDPAPTDDAPTDGPALTATFRPEDD